jgi:hypothetical protein
VQALNASFAAGSPGAVHVPPCDWYNNGTAPRCSGFYHDQIQTPNHPGGGRPYETPGFPNGVDGNCTEQCDCGGTNPCVSNFCLRAPFTPLLLVTPSRAMFSA